MGGNGASLLVGSVPGVCWSFPQPRGGKNLAIKVKRGDWLSKYSAAIHNDFIHVHEFGRKNARGLVEPVPDINKIVAGETRGN